MSFINKVPLQTLFFCEFWLIILKIKNIFIYNDYKQKKTFCNYYLIILIIELI